jgi:hypothetical protein
MENYRYLGPETPPRGKSILFLQIATSKQKSTNPNLAHNQLPPVGLPTMSPPRVGLRPGGTRPLDMSMFEPTFTSTREFEEGRRSQIHMNHAQGLSDQQRQQASGSPGIHLQNSPSANNIEHRPSHFFDPGEEQLTQEVPRTNDPDHAYLNPEHRARIQLRDRVFFSRVISHGLLDDLVNGSTGMFLPPEAVEYGRSILIHSAQPIVSHNFVERETCLYFWDVDVNGTKYLRWDWVHLLRLVPHWLSLMPKDIQRSYQIGSAQYNG